MNTSVKETAAKVKPPKTKPKKPKEPYCPFCKKRHPGGDTCMGHHP